MTTASSSSSSSSSSSFGSSEGSVGGIEPKSFESLRSRAVELRRLVRVKMADEADLLQVSKGQVMLYE